MGTVSLNKDNWGERVNIKQTGINDWDKPSVKYIAEGYRIPTKGELKKIVRKYWKDHDANLKPGEKKWGKPDIVDVYAYWRGYENEQYWYYLVRNGYPLENGRYVIGTYKITLKRENRRDSWNITDRYITGYEVEASVSNEEIAKSE